MKENVEIVELQEALEESRAEVERLQTLAADKEAQASRLEESLAEFRESVDRSNAEAIELRALVETLQSETGSLRDALALAQEQNRSASLKYRDAVLAATPELPADLVVGDTIEDIDSSIAQARQIVSHLKDHLESQTPARVPAGSPSRVRHDFGELSPQEKIALGLRRTT